jgi:hypothetical protein
MEQAMIQYIADGYTAVGDRAVLWRTADYTYHIEIGYGLTKRQINLNDTEYYDALTALKSYIVELVEVA